jgi:hypothetical protein
LKFLDFFCNFTSLFIKKHFIEVNQFKERGWRSVVVSFF